MENNNHKTTSITFNKPAHRAPAVGIKYDDLVFVPYKDRSVASIQGETDDYSINVVRYEDNSHHVGLFVGDCIEERVAFGAPGDDSVFVDPEMQVEGMIYDIQKRMA